ncbi:unnamed protein product [Pleuronectes platessa]|uniref:Uncharacterized protein n=1 Tax=Pleuronectes platessa TaxID=8262 RepID=A0A9N7YTQ7_PLEPL|nr:unnamed protein product [Pleuronectes platessa]
MSGFHDFKPVKVFFCKGFITHSPFSFQPIAPCVPTEEAPLPPCLQEPREECVTGNFAGRTDYILRLLLSRRRTVVARPPRGDLARRMRTRCLLGRLFGR